MITFLSSYIRFCFVSSQIAAQPTIFASCLTGSVGITKKKKTPFSTLQTLTLDINLLPPLSDLHLNSTSTLHLIKRMAPRPSSPTSLLWAHEPKREHQFLLDRINETNTAAISADEKISKLAARVKSIEKANDQIIQRLERLESSSKDATHATLRQTIESLDTRQTEHGSRLKEMQDWLSAIENANDAQNHEMAASRFRHDEVERNTRIQTPQPSSSGESINVLPSQLNQRDSRWYVWIGFNRSCTAWID